MATALPAQADEIPTGYRQVAAEYGIPTQLFYAVALTESRWATSSGRTLPWPWSLNVAGQAMRFPSRKAAWQALRTFLDQGKRRVDIGLMQINWGYHAKRFGDPWQALDPYHNLRVGAQILQNEYHRSDDWLEAAGRYHNPGTSPKQQRLAAAYRQRVLTMMQRIEDESS
ncbi:MAG: transglycosylase SLT domain-containing protein [Chromatiales bacterium]|nr:transglycosylase SLT domain-containing protein [Gammaproteobacteria bacterium]